MLGRLALGPQIIISLWGRNFDADSPNTPPMSSSTVSDISLHRSRVSTASRRSGRSPLSLSPVEATLKPATEALRTDTLPTLDRLRRLFQACETSHRNTRTRMASRLVNARKRLHARAKRTVENEVKREKAALARAHANALNTLQDRARGELLELAVAIAERVLSHELSESSKALIKRLELTLNALPPTPAKIHVNPRDVTEVSALTHSRELTTASSSEVIADPRYAPGSALILTRDGSIEVEWVSRLESVLANLRSAVRDLGSHL